MWKKRTQFTKNIQLFLLIPTEVKTREWNENKCKKKVKIFAFGR